MIEKKIHLLIHHLNNTLGWKSALQNVYWCRLFNLLGTKWEYQQSEVVKPWNCCRTVTLLKLHVAARGTVVHLALLFHCRKVCRLGSMYSNMLALGLSLFELSKISIWIWGWDSDSSSVCCRQWRFSLGIDPILNTCLSHYYYASTRWQCPCSRYMKPLIIFHTSTEKAITVTPTNRNDWHPLKCPWALLRSLPYIDR